MVSNLKRDESSLKQMKWLEENLGTQESVGLAWFMRSGEIFVFRTNEIPLEALVIKEVLKDFQGEVP